MTNHRLFQSWGILFLVSCLFSFLAETNSLIHAVAFIIGCCFFIPPFWILRRAQKSNNTHICQIIRNLSICSLTLTVLFLILSILALRWGLFWEYVFSVLLQIVSVPMFCLHFWVISLFAWAILFVLSFRKNKP